MYVGNRHEEDRSSLNSAALPARDASFHLPRCPDVFLFCLAQLKYSGLPGQHDTWALGIFQAYRGSQVGFLRSPAVLTIPLGRPLQVYYPGASGNDCAGTMSSSFHARSGLDGVPLEGCKHGNIPKHGQRQQQLSGNFTCIADANSLSGIWLIKSPCRDQTHAVVSQFSFLLLCH